jgi:hypothetical protein
MAVATRERTLVERPQPARRPSRLFEPGGATLEDSILRLWDELVAAGRVECPVCGGAMSAPGGCEGCGAELS